MKLTIEIEQDLKALTLSLRLQRIRALIHNRLVSGDTSSNAESEADFLDDLLNEIGKSDE